MTASPCRELLITEDVKTRAAVLADQTSSIPGNLSEMFEKISQGHAVDGMEALSTVLVDGLELLIDVLPANTVVLVADPDRVRARAHELVATSQEFLQASWAAAASGGQAPIDLASGAYRELADVRERALARGQAWWSLSPWAAAPVATVAPADDWDEPVDLGIGEAALAGVESRTVLAREAEVFRGDAEAGVAAVRAAVAGGQRVVLVADSPGLATRMGEVLAEAGIAARGAIALAEPPAARRGDGAGRRTAARFQPARRLPDRVHGGGPVRAA